MIGPERLLKDKIKADLKELGAYFYMPVPGGYGRQTVDFLCCLKGRFVAIETKAPGKKPTPRQAECLAEVTAAGGAAFWCDSFSSYRANMIIYDLIDLD